MEIIVVIELIGNNRYEKTRVEIADRGIVGIKCDNEKQKEDIISVVSGKNSVIGKCIFDEWSTVTNVKEYRRLVDYIDGEMIESTLSVSNYLLFYAMVTGIYYNDMEHEINSIVADIELCEKMNLKVNELEKVEQLMIRCAAAYLKNIRCLVSNNLFRQLEKEEKQKLYRMLEKYFVSNNCLCLVFEKNEKDLYEVVEKVIVI